MEIKGLYKSYNSLIVFQDLDMRFQENSITCILGPSGCGKTTLLNIISGLTGDYSGRVLGFEDKSFSYIFEEPRLLEWKSVYENMDFALSSAYAKEERKDKIWHYLEMVGLLEFRDYYPRRLSGGMAQRVSAARAFAYPSDILLMDEPFKKLDFRTRVNLIESFLKIWELDRRTVVFVTHSIDEAVLLGNRVYVLSTRPAKVKRSLDIDYPQSQRSLGESRLAGLKKDILAEFEK
jgi:NitT/TauT family transport system ATP-binding protein